MFTKKRLSKAPCQYWQPPQGVGLWTLERKVILQPLSPLVVGRKNDRGHYDYRSPRDEDFEDCLLHNWIEKLAATGNADEDTLLNLRQKVSVKVRLFPHPPQSRLITIKGGTDAETKIRGYTKFRLEVTAPEEMIELALGAGLGLYNAQGMGCVEVIWTGNEEWGMRGEGVRGEGVSLVGL